MVFNTPNQISAAKYVCLNRRITWRFLGPLIRSYAPPSPHQANAAKEEKDDNEKGRSSCEVSRADVRGEGAGGRGSVVPLLSLFQRVVKVRGERRRGEGVGGSS